MTVLDRVTDQRQHVSLNLVEDLNQFLIFDAVITETHVGTAETTDYPIEDGSDSTDHIRRQPEELQLIGVVSDAPLVEDPVNNASPAVSNGGLIDRSKEAYFFLLDVKDRGKLVTITTRLRQYTNMAITALSVGRDKDTSRIVQVDLTLREILIATTELVDAPTPIASTDNARTNQGKKTKRNETEANQEASRSVLSNLAGDSVSNFLGI